MSGIPSYIVRPLSKPARSDLKDVFRVYLSRASLLLHKLNPGDLCSLKSPGGNAIPAFAWYAAETLGEKVIQVSKPLQKLHNLRLGDEVSITRGACPVMDVQAVVLREVSQDGPDMPFERLAENDQSYWERFLDLPLKKAQYLCPGLKFELKDLKRSFRIEEVNSSRSSDSIYRFVQFSSVRLQTEAILAEDDHCLAITEDGIGGLEQQICKLNKYLADYSGDAEKYEMPSYHSPRRGGILLYGPPGTGKSLILQKVSKARWKKVIHVDSRTLKSYRCNVDDAVGMMFSDAIQHQPSVLIINNLESKVGWSGDATATFSKLDITKALSDGFDHLDDARVLVIAATSSLNAIDPSLRLPGRFETKMEIPVPNSRARREILKILCDDPRPNIAKHLEVIADRTHGFVGANLMQVVQLAIDIAVERVEKSQHLDEGLGNDAKESIKIRIEIFEADLDDAASQIRPSAMTGIFLETPKVYWSDIGGRAKIRQSIEEAIEWPFKVLSK